MRKLKINYEKVRHSLVKQKGSILHVFLFQDATQNRRMSNNNQMYG